MIATITPLMSHTEEDAAMYIDFFTKIAKFENGHGVGALEGLKEIANKQPKDSLMKSYAQDAYEKKRRLFWSERINSIPLGMNIGLLDEIEELYDAIPMDLLELKEQVAQRYREIVDNSRRFNGNLPELFAKVKDKAILPQVCKAKIVKKYYEKYQ